ncbi:hypothetical protein KCV87_31630 [Actinosynnema pretiosum subsp. pretiosum]|uniref:Uncharacterized protein n=1 Tax=Actinosynnema pretiosum subsp. pretiosum TaxID=103721 RepID=A0AA45L6R8_9PSEU|nr:hypothetical protein APASM_4813 [Actinosynnema pretiosum subsp. pretiosum]QUF03865.1 hypothetical protein KCV87_31630 [Actinosynnema pretiosum subsp. pretiosum]
MLENDLAERVDPVFRGLFAGPLDDVDVLRSKLIDYLEALSVALPAQERRVARVSLNLTSDAERGLQQRLELLTGELHLDLRTVRRRMDRAYGLIAEAAAHERLGDERGVGGWHVEAFDATLRLDVPTPEAIERSTIVVTAPELERITISADVPRAEGSGAVSNDLRWEVVHGGTLVGGDRRSSTHVSAALELPTPLVRGDRHVYEMIARIPPGQVMAPRYVCVPLRRYRYAALRVRFDPERLPSQVWKHDGDPHSAVQDGVPGEPLVLNRAHEVHVEFRDLATGYCYGVQWR